MNLRICFFIFSVALLAPFIQPLNAEKAVSTVIEITFGHHRFTPDKIEVPAGQAVVIRVINTSKERIEFESFRLNREKVVVPGQTITVRLPSLRPGSYDFFDDFHDDVPEGVIVAR